MAGIAWLMETIIFPRVEQYESRQRAIESLAAFAKRLPLNKPWRWRLDELKGDRTGPQNNALFGVAYPPLCKYLNCTDEALHQVMCQKFFGVKVLLGVPSPLRTTTTDLEGKRDVIPFDMFQDFYTMVQQVGADLEDPIYIPDPDPALRTR